VNKLKKAVGIQLFADYFDKQFAAAEAPGYRVSLTRPADSKQTKSAATLSPKLK
jgi:hypothetical protein